MRKIIAAIIIVILLTIAGLVVYYNSNLIMKYENKDLNINDLSNTYNYLEDGKIEISNIKFTKLDEAAYILSFMEENKTTEVLDLSDYVVDICDKNGKAIMTVDGNIVGSINANEKIERSINIAVDLIEAEILKFRKKDANIKDDVPPEAYYELEEE